MAMPLPMKSPVPIAPPRPIMVSCRCDSLRAKPFSRSMICPFLSIFIHLIANFCGEVCAHCGCKAERDAMNATPEWSPMGALAPPAGHLLCHFLCRLLFRLLCCLFMLSKHCPFPLSTH